MRMSSFTIVPIIALFCYLFLLISFLAAKKDAAIYAFMELLLTMVIWASGSLFMRLAYWPSESFWFHVSLTGLLMIPLVFYRFLKRFLRVEKSYHIHFWTAAIILMLLVNYKYSIFVQPPEVLSLGNGSNAYVYHLRWQVVIPFLVEGGALFACSRMVYENSRENKFAGKSLRPVWLGIGALALGQIGIALPVFRGFPIDICSGIVMAVCVYYALYQKRLFRLDLLVSKANCFVAAFVISTLIFYSFIPNYNAALEKYFGFKETQLTMVAALSMVLAAILIYFIIKAALDTVFEKDEITQSRCIGEFSTGVSYLTNVGEILGQLMQTIEKAVPAEAVLIFLKDEAGDYVLTQGNQKTEEISCVIPKDEKVFGLLRESGGCILSREHRNTPEYKKFMAEIRRKMPKYKIECIAGIKDDEQYLGLIFLTGKKNGENYTAGDLNFFESISSVAFIAIQNSRLYEKAYQEARRDYLTGAANRKYFYEVLEQCCESQTYAFGSIIMIDVDDFKLYNQLYGTGAGDDALKRIAEIIQAEVGKKGMVARYSGKVFTVMLPGTTEEEAKAVADRISEQVREMNSTSGENAMKILTVSCGIALGVCPIHDFHDLIGHADTAVYYAKKAGKNRTVIYKEGNGGERPSQMGYQPGVYSDYAPTIYALTAAIDAKDHYTFSHSENVAYYARELARAYGMNEEGLKIIYEAGLLHDIGKIGIEESVLNKPGRLTPEEYEKVKSHVELSIGIIRHLPSLDYVIPAVIGHHERYDGKGYPRGIKGEEIPLMARILCVADSFDAMVTVRSYKPGIEVEDALRNLEEESGRQFDPRLVPVFVRCVRDGIIEIR